MSEDEFDEEAIAQWAENLTPEGSPGVMTAQMRAYLGDEGYEKMKAANESATSLHLQRQTLTNSLLAMLLIYGVLFGVVGLVGSVALVIQIIFQ